MERKSIKTDELTHSKLMFISDRLNMPLSRFLKELTEKLFDVCSEFKKMVVFYDAYGNTLRIEFEGKSILVNLTAPNDETAKRLIETEFAKKESDSE